jgi:hypothetical protein
MLQNWQLRGGYHPPIHSIAHEMGHYPMAPFGAYEMDEKAFQHEMSGTAPAYGMEGRASPTKFRVETQQRFSSTQ